MEWLPGGGIIAMTAYTRVTGSSVWKREWMTTLQTDSNSKTVCLSRSVQVEQGTRGQGGCLSLPHQSPLFFSAPGDARRSLRQMVTEPLRFWLS